ncbi:cysteine-rich CWC family protein [Paenibacillus dendritiformis]|uniref:cysteine-rich CWC family protein n=1 Tax=Paenibacillus dendritiformis TaxID=130049 RepID=UPI000DAA3D8B|nr:cysteine-rich CWC family protein [Paenibacillus dendritiformis]PZM64783.1 hypothetical protein DOE73_15220 [Paenibacillus dendritiformis]
MNTVLIDPQRCPLCGQPNHCAYAAGRPHTECWCMKRSVPQELLEQIPAEQRRKACVCEECVKAFMEKNKD